MSLTKPEIENALKVVSRAWGRTQSGYAFFPWIDRQQQMRTGIRRAGFHEGPSFLWPDQKDMIVDHLYEHQSHDVYWCPSLFEEERRNLEVAMDEHALWADLDAVDPRTLEEYPPTIAWETSPGRYQALWLAGAQDFLGASWPGNENQRMTYMIEADPSGWDTTQLLRLPGFYNHKPEYGEPQRGHLLWSNGRTYLPGDFKDLPPVAHAITSAVSEALAADIDGVDRHKVIARVRLSLNHKARELLNARSAGGDLSESLWYLTRCLADAGCSIAEIVAVVKETVWNKFKDRHDEIRTLINEASKAIAKRSEEVKEKLEEAQEEERPTPRRLGAILINVKRPKFLVDNVITEGACGFIGGEPKQYKSWVGLDLAFSVATGTDFLGHFRVPEPGPVFYIQEEDPAPTLKTRSAKVWAGKQADKLELVPQGDMPTVMWLPPSVGEFDPDVNAIIQSQFTISDEAWMIYLDEQLSKGMEVAGSPTPYKLLLIDTLMMTAGAVEENKSQEMTTKIFKPLKFMSRKHNIAVIVVHHLNKSDKPRPGQRLLGSVANHAWAEDSIYLSDPLSGTRVRMDLESKSIPAQAYAINNIRTSREWLPQITSWNREEDTAPAVDLGGLDSWPQDISKAPNDGVRNVWLENNRKAHALRDAILRVPTGQTADQLAHLFGIAPASMKQRLRRFETRGEIKKQGARFIWVSTTSSN